MPGLGFVVVGLCVLAVAAGAASAGRLDEWVDPNLGGGAAESCVEHAGVLVAVFSFDEEQDPLCAEVDFPDAPAWWTMDGDAFVDAAAVGVDSDGLLMLWQELDPVIVDTDALFGSAASGPDRGSADDVGRVMEVPRDFGARCHTKVPEPTTAGILGLGGAWMLLLCRHHRQ